MQNTSLGCVAAIFAALLTPPLLQDPTEVQALPWRHASWHVLGLSLRDLRALLSSFGQQTTGTLSNCVSRLLACSASFPLLDEATLAAATAALLQRLRLLAADGLPDAFLLAPPAGGQSVGKRRVQATNAGSLYTAAGMRAALQAESTAGPGQSEGPGQSSTASPKRRAHAVCSFLTHHKGLNQLRAVTLLPAAFTILE
jgi:hypothetical protein